MAGNAFKTTTNVWEVDTAGTLNTGGVSIQHITMTGNAGDQLKLTDNADNIWIHLWIQAKDSTFFFPFVPPIKMPSLKVATISGGLIAHIQLRTDLND